MLFPLGNHQVARPPSQSGFQSNHPYLTQLQVQRASLAAGAAHKMDSRFLLMEVAGDRRQGSCSGGFPETSRGSRSFLTIATNHQHFLQAPSDAGRQLHNLHLRFADEFNKLAERLPPVTMSQDAWSGEVWARAAEPPPPLSCLPELLCFPDCSSCSTAEDIASSFIAAELESDLFILGFSSIAL